MTELADKIDALAEKATPGPWRIRENARHSQEECDLTICGDIWQLADINGPQYDHQEANAALIVELVNARETLTRALRAEARMREALERIVHLGDTFRYDSDEDVFRLVDDTQNCARQALGDNT